MKIAQLLNHLASQKGFSLAEVMVAAGVLSFISLGTMQLMTNVAKSQTQSEAKQSVASLQRQITNILNDKVACTNTLAGFQFGQEISQIKSANNTVIYEKSKKINNSIIIKGMTIKDRGVSVTSGKKLAELVILAEASKKITKGPLSLSPIGLQVEINSSTGKIIECYTDIDGIKDSTISEACLSAGGIYNPSTQKCDLDDYVKITGDMMTGPLTTTALIAPNIISTSITASKIEATKLCINGACRTTFATQLCPDGQVARGLGESGAIICLQINCPSNHFLETLDAVSGLPVCKPLKSATCPTKQYVSKIASDGSITCSPLPTNSPSCPFPKAIQSIDANGNATCTDTVPSFSCPASHYLRAYSVAGGAVCVPYVDLTNKTCPTNTFLVGVDSVGNLICKSMGVNSYIEDAKRGSTASSSACDDWVGDYGFCSSRWGSAYRPNHCAARGTKSYMSCIREELV